MRVKPFYIKYESWMTEQQVQSVFDKAVKCGAVAWEGLSGSGFRTKVPYGCYFYFGVRGGDTCTCLSDDIGYYGSAINITLDQVDEHLGLVKPTPNQPSLLGTKIDLRKPDGSVDKELSTAFQEACFEQGIQWGYNGDKVSRLSACYLFVDDCLLKYDDADYSSFKNHKNKQIEFSYNRKLEWSIKDMTEERKIVTVGGVDYYEEDLLAAVSALEAAKVEVGITIQAGGGTPPERPTDQDEK